MSRKMTPLEIAELIDRFLTDQLRHPQEWNGFVDSGQKLPASEELRRACSELDPLVNTHEPQDAEALAQLRELVAKVRSNSKS